MVDIRARRGPLALFANLKMAQKLLVGFLAVAVLMVGVGVVGLTKVTAVEKNLEYVYAQNLQPIAWLGQVMTNVENSRRALLNLNLVTEPLASARARAEIARQDRLADVNWAKYVATDMRGREKLRDDFDAAMLAYRTVRDTQLIPLIETGRTADFVALRDKLANPLTDRINADLTVLLDLEQKTAASQVASAAAQYQSARNLIIGIILAALALSIGLAIGIGRMISRPLQRTVDALEGLAEGRLDLQLDVDTRDEVGQMARALSRSSARLGELIEADQRKALIVESSQDAIVSKSLEDIIASWNPAAERMFGYSSQEIIGQRGTLLGPADRANEIRDILAKVSAGQPIEPLETIGVRKDGTMFPVSLTVSPIHDLDGAVVGASMVSRDITELKHAALYARSLIEAGLDPLMMLSTGGQIFDVNEATVRATGVPRDTLIGSDFSRYFTDPDKAKGVYQQVLAQGQVTGYPLTVRHRDGTLTDVLYNATVYRDLNGNVLGVLAAARDVTRLMQAQRQLQVADEAIRGFTAVAAHDLRSPLVSILGFSAILTNNWETLSEENRRKFVATIERQSQNMSRLVDDLFTLATIDAGGLVTSPEPIVLRETIDRTLARGHPDAESVPVACSPDLTVRVDPAHLERILDNYVQNAFKYGEPPLSIEATRVGDMVEVRVLDHGPGVPPEFVSRLFGKFARADTAATRAKKGTGLGLSIVRGLAEANGGRARHEPNVPTGSCFVVELPAGDGRPREGDL